MNPKPDISGRADIERFLWTFYEKAFDDELIGRFFTQVVPLNLDTHIPVITDFWESVVFNNRGYRKNVMEIHRHIHHLSPIQKEHLERWVQIFTQTADEFFEGEKNNLMKQRALSIATLMELKLGQ